MTLVEECRLRLDDPVDDLLPELANRQVLRSPEGPVTDTVPARRPVTVRDLLTFTWGFGMLLGPPEQYPILAAAADLGLSGPPRPQELPDPDEYLRRLGELPLMYQPGERWLYQTGSDVLGVLLARLTGRSLGQLLRERLFEPLGMVDTAFSVPPDQIHRLPTAYLAQQSGGTIQTTLYDEATGGQWATPPRFESGGGGLVSTVDDFAAFGTMLLDQGRHGTERILARPTVQLMTTDQHTPAQKASSGFFPGYFDHLGWAFGLAVVTGRTDLAAVPGRYGWDGGLGTTWWSDPTEDLVAIMLTQRGQFPLSAKVYRDFWTCAYQAIDD
jgi:CubicO group peptidase (beta-lactamase class C family)